VTEWQFNIDTSQGGNGMTLNLRLTDGGFDSCLHHILPYPMAEESAIHSRSRDYCQPRVSLHSEQTGLLQCVLAQLPASTIAPLQHVQNVAARLNKDLHPQDHVTPALLFGIVSHINCVYLCIWCILAAAHRIGLVS